MTTRRDFFLRVGGAFGITLLVSRTTDATCPDADAVSVGLLDAPIRATLSLVADDMRVVAPPLIVSMRNVRETADGAWTLTYPPVTWKGVEAGVRIAGLRVVLEVPGLGPVAVMQRFPVPVRSFGGDVTVDHPAVRLETT